MTPQLLFDLAFPLAARFWLLMIVAPGWSWTRRIVSSPLIVVPPLLVYVALLVPQFAAFAGPVVSPDLPGLAAVLGTQAGAAAIRERGLHPLVMAPVLVLTILLSPLGLLAHLLVRTAGARSPAAPRPAAG